MGAGKRIGLPIVHRISKYRPRRSHLTGTMIDMCRSKSRDHPVYWTEFRHPLDRILGQNIVQTHTLTGATWRIEIDTCPIDGGITDLDIEGVMGNEAAKPVDYAGVPMDFLGQALAYHRIFASVPWT